MPRSAVTKGKKRNKSKERKSNTNSAILPCARVIPPDCTWLNDLALLQHTVRF